LVPYAPLASVVDSRPPRFLATRRVVSCGLALLALGMAARAAAAEMPTWSRFAASLPPSSAALVAQVDGVARLAIATQRRRVGIYSTAGIGLLYIPIAAFLRRRRRKRKDSLERLGMNHRSRFSEVFGAALVDRPPLRPAGKPAPEERASDTPPVPEPLTPEVVAHANALSATSAREAAERALLLSTASERSESYRRAAALRARAGREERTEAWSDVNESPAAAVAPGTVGIELEPPAMPQLAATAGPISAEAPANFLPTAAEALATPRPTAAEAAPAASVSASLAAAVPAEPRAETPDPEAPKAGGTRRVALLAASGPLTFEWLERCLTRDAEDLEARLDLCTTLLVAERFADAERMAREGLERDVSSGRLLLRLSEAIAGQGRTAEALEVAIRAVRSHRSRKAILHLTRLSALAHRFAPSDGPRLRKALESRPRDPVFLHALGVFESLHGSSRHALTLLRLALRLERTPRWRLIVAREIARLRAEELAAGSREPLRIVG
jgi:tetratricopeptide (TPR) repeat protein